MTAIVKGLRTALARLNMRLSQPTASVETVKRFLTDKGIDQARIVSSIDESIQDDLERRVMVKMMAPDGLSGR